MLQEISRFHLPGVPKQVQVIHSPIQGVVIGAISYTMNRPCVDALKAPVNSFICMVEQERPAMAQIPPQQLHLPIKQHIKVNNDRQESLTVHRSEIRSFCLFSSQDGEQVYLLVQVGTPLEEWANDDPRSRDVYSSTSLYRRVVSKEPPVSSSLSDEEEEEEKKDDTSADPNHLFTPENKYIMNSRNEYIYYIRLPYPVEDGNIFFHHCVALSPETPYTNQSSEQKAALQRPVAQVLAAGGGGLTGQPSSLLLYSVYRNRVELEFKVHLSRLLGNFLISQLIIPPGTESYHQTVLLQCQHMLLQLNLSAVIDVVRQARLTSRNTTSAENFYVDVSAAVNDRFAWDRHELLSCSAKIHRHTRHLLSATECGTLLLWDLMGHTCVARKLFPKKDAPHTTVFTTGQGVEEEGVAITGLHAPSFTDFYVCTSNGLLLQWTYNNTKVALDAGIAPPSSLTDYSEIEIQYHTTDNTRPSPQGTGGRFDYTPTLLTGSGLHRVNNVGGEGFQCMAGSETVLLTVREFGLVSIFDVV